MFVRVFIINIMSFFCLFVCLLIQISSTEPTAEDFAAERKRDGTPYFRFNPTDIKAGTLEVNPHKLVNMMFATKQYLSKPGSEQIMKLERVVQLLVN